ncbi:hypothetical protein FDH01_gp319 [Acinetobacter phage vB_AbaM_ME3]|uniref:Uncharacterized protein n=1 Tax=Acinetobacter phage vB_AbaM_ME3 TaxID=1837876 RepID=A0A172Q0J3_9CAUD|nr:hypothetical protein FDH01_gp319 [Acinetobacter phage vB_AbaM_ME3]AND75303.1 hypothetical protein ME3_142 [Acinetobacter phage vB_AbaM_ME3]
MLYENINIDITEDQIKLTYTSYEVRPLESKKTGLVYNRRSDQSVEAFRKDSLKLLCEHLLLITTPSEFLDFIKSNLNKED